MVYGLGLTNGLRPIIIYLRKQIKRLKFMTILLINEQISLEQKPKTTAEYGEISELTVKNNQPKHYTGSELFRLIACEGHPFFTCAFYNTYADDNRRASSRAAWRCQLAYALDWDTQTYTMEQAIEMTPAKLNLVLAYHTFGSTKEQNKFRLIFDCVDKPFAGYEYHMAYLRHINHEYYLGQADKRAISPCKFWQGSTKCNSYVTK